MVEVNLQSEKEFAYSGNGLQAGETTQFARRQTKLHYRVPHRDMVFAKVIEIFFSVDEAILIERY